MKDPIVKKSHKWKFCAKCFARLQGGDTYKDMTEATLDRHHTSAKCVRSVSIDSQDSNMKDCTRVSSHIFQCMMKHLVAEFARRNWEVLPSSLATMMNTWSCLDFVSVDQLIWFNSGIFKHRCSVVAFRWSSRWSHLLYGEIKRYYLVRVTSVTPVFREHFL